jgi:DNA polymerase III epsilon subunit-like protein
MYLFFDTETTGLPKNWKAGVEDVNNWPRLVQIAWIFFDAQGNKIASENFIIKPNGFIIPKEAEQVHGISTAFALKEGKDIEMVLDKFYQALGETKFLVAHNISFDEKILGAEFLRVTSDYNPLDKISKICTMKSTSSYCQIPGPRGFKWPNLSELHRKLFNKDFDNAHDALADVEACASCFFELRRRGVL